MSAIPFYHQRTARILEISHELTSTTALDRLLHQIAEAAAELTDTESAGVLLFDELAGELRFVAATQFADRLFDIPVPVDGSIAGVAFRSGQPVIVPDVRVDPRYCRAPEEATGFVARSLLAVPLQLKQRRVGVLEVENKRDNSAFNQNDVDVLIVLAAQATAAIENARLVAALNKQQELAESLRQASAALNSTLNYQEVLGCILEQIGRVVPNDAANVMIIEADGQTARVFQGRGYERFGTAATLTATTLNVDAVAGLRQMRQTRRPLLVADVEHDDTWVYSRPEHVWIKSYVGAPIFLRDRVLGFLNAMSAAPDFFSQADAERLQTFAHHAAIAIENARLFAQAQQEISERVKAEAELRRHRDHLEELVEQRVAEILRINAELARVNEELRHEIAERKRVEADLRHYTERVQLLHEIDQAILGAQSPQAIARSILGRVSHLVPCKRVSVVEFDAETAHVLAVEATHGFSADLGWLDQLGAAARGQTRIQGVADIRSLTRRSPWQERLLAEGMCAYLSVPLLVQERTIGALVIESDQPDVFMPEHVDVLAQVGAMLAVAIHQAQLRDSLQQRTEELQAQNAELDAFAHTVAHDLKNPLGLVASSAQLLADYGDALRPEQLRETAQLASRGAFKAADIVNNLLLLASAHKMKVELQPVDMARVVEEALGRLANMIQEYQPDLVVPATWPTALGYAPWIEEVWTNYISNAIKYGGWPLRIELVAERLERTSPADPAMVRFGVRDNGRGLSPEEQARLFTPFERLSQVQTKGHGLGLSIVKRIVDRLGGQVGVESQVGQGSLFYFTLPAA